MKRMIGFIKAELIDKEEVQGAEEFLGTKEEKRREQPKKVCRRGRDQEIER